MIKKTTLMAVALAAISSIALAEDKALTTVAPQEEAPRAKKRERGMESRRLDLRAVRRPSRGCFPSADL